MEKARAIELFGSVGALADAVGVTSSAVTQWPDVLPDRLEDRVVAALARTRLPGHVRRLLAEGTKAREHDAS